MFKRTLFLEQKYRLMAFELQRGADYNVNFHVAGLYKQCSTGPCTPTALKVVSYMESLVGFSSRERNLQKRSVKLQSEENLPTSMMSTDLPIFLLTYRTRTH